MAINLTNVLSQIQNRISDSTQTDRDLNKLIAAANRINNSGTQTLTYQSTGQLPSLADSNYIGIIARVVSDNVFGDSDGRFYYASGTDSGWRGFKTTQDSADALIEAPAAAGGGGGTLHQLAATSGYRVGGTTPAASAETRVQKFPFASSTSGSFVSGLTLSAGRYLSAGTMSQTHGYRHAGSDTNGTPVKLNDIEKFPFASEDAFTDVGNLTESKSYVTGGGTSSSTHGYRHGGWPATNVIDKYSFSADGNATDVGDLLRAAYAYGASHSETHGYSVAGYDVPGTQRIQKYSFASDGNATPVGNLTIGPQVSYVGNNAQSLTHGYHVGGYIPAGRQNVIAKFSFSSDGDATDVGDLTSSRQDISNASSSDGYTYAHGGNPGSNPYNVNVIERFAHNSDGNAVDAGDLALESYQSAAVQN